MWDSGLRRLFVAASILGLTLLVPVGASGAKTLPAGLRHTCNLLSAGQAGTFLGGTASETGGNGSCLYFLPPVGTMGHPGPAASIVVTTSTKINSVRTVSPLLSLGKLTVIQHPPKGTPARDSGFDVSTGRDFLPQANIATLVDGVTVQIVVTGPAQPQRAAEAAMKDALSHVEL